MTQIAPQSGSGDKIPGFVRWIPVSASIFSVILSIGTLFWALSTQINRQQSTVDYHEKRIAAIENTIDLMRKDMIVEQRSADSRLADLNRKIDVLVAQTAISNQKLTELKADK